MSNINLKKEICDMPKLVIKEALWYTWLGFTITFAVIVFMTGLSLLIHIARWVV